MHGKVIITGGAGYLGRAILRQAKAMNWDAQFTVYSRDEEKQNRLRLRYPDVRCILGDVNDVDTLGAAVTGHDFLIHAAAVKFVPEAEFNVAETVRVNVDGTLAVARAAARAGIKTAIFISTDKACLPVNLYGATKMAGEKIWTEANRWGETHFATARYGNVVGSTGSIVPVFRRQLAQHGKVLVTNPHMTRFWMSADQAVATISHALEYADQMPGIIVARKCRSLDIGTVAQVIAGEAPVEVIGARPGEKMHEELLHRYEADRAYEGARMIYIMPSTSTIAEREAFWKNHPNLTACREPYTSDYAERIGADTMAEMVADAEEIA